MLILLILKNAELFFSCWCTSQNSAKFRVLIDCKGNVGEHGTKWEITSLHLAVKVRLSFELLKLYIFFFLVPSPFFFLPFFSPLPSLPFSHPSTNQAQPCLAFEIVDSSLPFFCPPWGLFVYFFLSAFYYIHSFAICDIAYKYLRISMELNFFFFAIIWF